MNERNEGAGGACSRWREEAERTGRTREAGEGGGGQMTKAWGLQRGLGSFPLWATRLLEF